MAGTDTKALGGEGQAEIKRRSTYTTRKEPTLMSSPQLTHDDQARLGLLLEEVRSLPEIPVNAHDFGAAIEAMMITITRIAVEINALKEQAAWRKENHTKVVRGDKATLNEKDKGEVARLCAEDQILCAIEQGIKTLSEAMSRWDARRSRLNRDFEIARIDYEHRRRLAVVDYETNRRRNSQ